MAARLGLTVKKILKKLETVSVQSVFSIVVLGSKESDSLWYWALVAILVVAVAFGLYSLEERRMHSKKTPKRSYIIIYGGGRRRSLLNGKDSEE